MTRSIIAPSMRPLPVGISMRVWKSSGASVEFTTEATRRAVGGSMKDPKMTGRPSTPRAIAKMRSVLADHHVGSCSVTRIEDVKGIGTFTCQPPKREFLPKYEIVHGADGSALPTNAACDVCSLMEAAASPST